MSGRRRRLHDFFKVLNKINIVLRFLFFAPTLFQKISYKELILDFVENCGLPELRTFLVFYLTTTLHIACCKSNTNKQTSHVRTHQKYFVACG